MGHGATHIASYQCERTRVDVGIGNGRLQKADDNVVLRSLEEHLAVVCNNAVLLRSAQRAGERLPIRGEEENDFRAHSIHGQTEKKGRTEHIFTFPIGKLIGGAILKFLKEFAF